MAVAIKHSDDQDAYAFNSESYAAWAVQGDFRHRDFQLGMGNYDLEAVASVGGIKPASRTFLLTCDSTGFSLMEG